MLFLLSPSALVINQAASVLQLNAHIKNIDSIDTGEGVG